MAINEDELELILKALAFAAHKHKDQRRRDVEASPYINHPITLANILCNEAHVKDKEVICAALLHDTVEDTDTTETELGEKFGATICGIVMDVTDDKSLRKLERKQRQIDHAAHISDQAKLVKLADKISNLRDMADCPPAGWDLDRRREYFDWAKAVIDRLRGVHGPLEAIFDKAYARRP
jgi:guanosine-3',5'-bis(diphosphate) 3'-pyrophosphohydrolase